MCPDLEDLINEAAVLSNNDGVQMTAYKRGNTSVHFIYKSGKLGMTQAPTLRQALLDAIEIMQLQNEWGS